MRSTGFLVLLAIAAPGAFAIPCVTGLLSAYEALGSTGCGVGPFTVKDFSFSTISANFTILDTDITVTPVFGPSSYGLTFSSPKFNISGNQFAHYLLAYTWDPSSIRSLEDILNTSTPVSPGIAKITTDACRDAAFVAVVCGTTVDTIVVSHDGVTPNLLASVNYSPPIATIGIRDTIELDANGASSQFNDFSNLVIVPEPSALVGCLVGFAAMFVGLRRR